MRSYSFRDFHKSRVVISALIGVLVLCCFFLAAFKIADSVVYQGMQGNVSRTLKPGMAERQVYESLSHIGSLQVFFQGRGSCQVGSPVVSERVWIRLRSDSWFPSSMELYMCFDDRGTLIDFREMFS